MTTRRFWGLPLACALGACITSSASGPPAAGEAPPRLSTAADEAPGIASVLSLCGLAVVGNVDALHFRMELAGEKVGVRPGQPHDTYLVDGLRAQVTTVAADEISPAARGAGAVGLLRMHATWESARRSQALGRDVQPEELGIRTADNMPVALVWWFPSAGEEAVPGKEGDTAAEGGAAPAPASPPPAAAEPARPTGVAFMTAAFDQRVLALSVEGQRGESKAALVAKAEAWMASVATSPRAISVKQASADSATATASGQTCPGRPNAVLEP